MRFSLRFFFLTLLMSSAVLAASGPASESEREKYVARAKSEQWGRPIGEHVQKLQHRSSKVNGSFLLPVVNTWLKSNPLNLYLINRKGKALVLPSFLGPEAKNLLFVKLEGFEFGDENKDGYGDFTVIAEVKNPKTNQTQTFRGTMLSDRAASFAPAESASPLKKTIAVDCSANELGKQTALAACKTAENALELKLTAGSASAISIKPEGSSVPDHVEVQGFDERAVAVTWDGTECARVVVLRLSDGKTLGDTGCKNAAYCGVARFPKAPECRVSVSCGEAPAAKSEIDICS